MTREEKIKILQNYCVMQGRDNDGRCKCPHSWEESFFCHQYSSYSASEEILDEWVKAVAPQSSEKVNHPAHYQGKRECIDEMVALFGVDAVIGFCKCNVHKYRYRAADKNGQEDLDKADWYMDKLMELEEQKNAEN